MNPRSIRFRLIAWYAGLLTGAFLLFGVALYEVLQGYLVNSLAETLTRRSEQIAASLLSAINKTGDRFVADQIATRYAPENYDRFIRITRPDGSVLYASGRAASFDPSGLPPSPVTSAKAHFVKKSLLNDGNLLLLTADIFPAGAGR